MATLCAVWNSLIWPRHTLALAATRVLRHFTMYGSRMANTALHQVVVLGSRDFDSVRDVPRLFSRYRWHWVCALLLFLTHTSTWPRGVVCAIE